MLLRLRSGQHAWRRARQPCLGRSFAWAGVELGWYETQCSLLAEPCFVVLGCDRPSCVVQVVTPRPVWPFHKECVAHPTHRACTHARVRVGLMRARRWCVHRIRYFFAAWVCVDRFDMDPSREYPAQLFYARAPDGTVLVRVAALASLAACLDYHRFIISCCRPRD